MDHQTVFPDSGWFPYMERSPVDRAFFAATTPQRPSVVHSTSNFAFPRQLPSPPPSLQQPLTDPSQLQSPGSFQSQNLFPQLQFTPPFFHDKFDYRVPCAFERRIGSESGGGGGGGAVISDIQRPSVVTHSSDVKKELVDDMYAAPPPPNPAIVNERWDSEHIFFPFSGYPLRTTAGMEQLKNDKIDEYPFTTTLPLESVPILPSKAISKQVAALSGKESDEDGSRNSSPRRPGGDKAEHRCQVCLTTHANGLHFGARTCAACAAFFRRTVSDDKKYTCKRSQRCTNVQQKRNAPQAIAAQAKMVQPPMTSRGPSDAVFAAQLYSSLANTHLE